ncbi:MAG: hypothetical protein KY464_14340 [Gemmatimonadetes bacterium]|nr:hypothetical protein [Gemmatimonadota bacterium]
MNEHTHRSRGILARASLALGLILFLVACDRGGEGGAAGEADVPEAQRYGGTAVVATYGDVTSMLSLTSSENTGRMLQQEVLFMPLIKFDEEINPVPWLAERWDTVRVAPDSLDLIFRIRRDVKWHDGQPTTAKDVLFTFERAINPLTVYPGISSFDFYSRRAELMDPYTVRFRLRPHSDFLAQWYDLPIMPEHILGEVPPEGLAKHPFGPSKPLGNGPFRFVRRSPGVEWVFEANPDFPAALGGRPYLDRLVYRNIPEQTTLLTELLTGTIDVYMAPNPNQAEQIKNAPGVRLSASPSRQWNYLAFNTRRPLFRDARVRRAIAMGLNREEMVRALVYGYGSVGRSTVTPIHWSYDENDPQTMLPYDTAAARRLLTEAGWVDRNRDGIIENAQGQPFRFTLMTNAGNDLRRDIIQIVQAQLRPVGIDVRPQLVEFNSMIDQLYDPSRPFDAVVSGWVESFRKDDRDILHSANIDKPQQYVGFANARADFLIDTLGVITDREEARPLWREYQHLMVREAPYIPLYYPERLNGVRTRLQGAVIDIRGELPTVAKWWILPSERRAGTAVPRAGRDSARRDSAPVAT